MKVSAASIAIEFSSRLKTVEKIAFCVAPRTECGKPNFYFNKDIRLLCKQHRVYRPQ